MKSPAYPCNPAQASIIPQKSESFSISLTRSSLAIQCGWRAQSHKEAALRLLVCPSLPITQAIETDEILSPLYWFLCITVFFPCHWRPPNPIGRVLVLQRSREDSLYPVIPLTLNKRSRVGGERHEKESRQGHYWKMVAVLVALWFILNPMETEWIWVEFVLTLKVLFLK